MPAAIITLCDVQYMMSFDRTGPSLTLTPVSASGAAIEGILDCCKCNYAIFAFGGLPICDGERDTDNKGCGNILRIKVELSCCPPEGWEGPGWYCVTTDTDPINCAAAELFEEDICDADFTICSGPYATRAEAYAVCPPPASTCCPEEYNLPLDTYINRSISGVEMWAAELTPGQTYTLFYHYSTSLATSVGISSGDCAGASTTLYTSPGGTGGNIYGCVEFTVPADQPVVCVTWASLGATYFFSLVEGGGHCDTCTSATALTLGVPVTGTTRVGAVQDVWRVTVAPSTAYKVTLTSLNGESVGVSFDPRANADCSGAVTGSGASGTTTTTTCIDFTTGPGANCLCLGIFPALDNTNIAEYELTVEAGTC